MRKTFGICLTVLLLFQALLAPQPLAAAPDAPAANALRISQIYGGGGNSGATYTNDFIELFNGGTVAADLAGYSVQYASSTGTTWQVTALSGSLAPGQYYLIQEAAGSGGTTPLPTPDATGSIAMSATNGKVALVSSTTALSGSCPTVGVVDFIGFGSANCFEGVAAAPVLSNTTAALRAAGGCTDTDDNSADFATGAPAPRNSASLTNVCVADAAPTVASTDPAADATGVAVNSDVSVTFSEPVGVSGGWFRISCATSGVHAAIVTGGPTAWTLNPEEDFAAGESCTVTIYAAQVADQDGELQPMAADHVWSFTTAAPAGPVAIINEVDADTVGTDTAEFIELYDGGAGNTSLDGLALVLYNGNGDVSYNAFDLDGRSTDAEGYFVLCGNAANVPNCDVDVSPDTDLIQNGQDAVALYQADASSFPNGTAVTTVNLIDAIVYDTSDADDAGLLVLLNAGQPQVDENANTNAVNESNQRCPNGSGGARNTDTYEQWPPTAGAANVCGADDAPAVASTDPAADATGVAVDASISVTFSEDVAVGAGWYGITCATSGAHTAVVSGGPAAYTLDPDALFAYSEICTVTIYAAQVTDLDASDPPDAMAADYAWSFTTAAAPLPVINEFSASTTGTDVEFIELYGPANMDYSAYRVLEIEGDAGNVGVVDEVIALGTADAAGFYLANLAANTLENGTITLLLVKDFTGAAGDDLDTNDDGVLDAMPWSEIADSVATNDGGAGAITYGVPTLGVGYDGLAFAPGGASRIPDGYDTDAATDWVRNDFDLAGIPTYTGTPVVGEAYNTPGAPNQVVADAAPTVASTEPANSATGVAMSGDVTVTFSEPVTPTGSWYQISCATSGAHTAAVSGGPTSWTLNPDTDFAAGETCTVTIYAASVVDQDGTPDAMAANYAWSFTTGSAGFTKISAIQGSGSAAASGTFSVEAIVVGDYQGVAGVNDYKLDGFFIQEEDADADGNPATSEGIFVFCLTCPTDVVVGDMVQVTGATSEYFGMSQLSATTTGSVVVVSGGNTLPTPASLTLPVPGVTATDLPGATAQINAYYEAFEGMLVTVPDTLSVTEYFELSRYGQLVLAQGGRFRQFTDVADPSAAGYTAHQIDLAQRKVILDDDSNQQNHALMENPDIPVFHPTPGFSISNYVRGGDTITNLTGVLHWSFAGLTGTDAWRIRPVTGAFSYAFQPGNPRPAAPAVGGNIRVASFNVLNYFTTLGSRGASSAAELDRQAAKIVAAMQSLNADVLGLMEIENNGTAVQDLVDRLNAVAGAGTYAAISTGVVGTDVITVAIIYKPGRVIPVGAAAALTDAAFTDPNNTGTQKSRPALAQTFEDAVWGERFTVVVNHLKSKGSCPSSGPDADQGDGQGCWNDTRTKGAAYLVNTWLPSDPTGSGDPDFIVMGDLNAYRRENPITAIKGAAYMDQIAAWQGAGTYGYVFDGQLGYLDHALSSATLSPQVTGAAQWHINSDEVNLLDYNDTIQDPGENDYDAKPAATELYEANAYRSSDHDPVLLGLGLYPDLGDLPATYGEAWHTGQGVLRLGELWTGDATSVPAGDDASDDGVRPVSGFNWTADQGGKLSVTVTGGSGYLSGWADYNGDGVFDAGEALLLNQAVVAGPDQEFSFAIPEGVTVSGSLSLRFRLYPTEQVDPTPTPTGRAEGGEVEDYLWSFGPNAVGLLNLQASAAGSAVWPALGYGGFALLALLAVRRRK